MSNIYKSVEALVGDTPLYEPVALQKALGLKARLLLKLEFFNPAGSTKDRAAREMILAAEKRGDLKKGSVIIEPTSGNTGIALAALSASRGYEVIIVMPDTMSLERRKLMTAYGAKLVLTDGKQGMSGAIEKANELAKTIENSFIPSQFENPDNAAAHYKTTGAEIWRDTDGEIDYFVAGVGTGGTISGVAKYLKEQKADIKIVAVEPCDSAVLSGEKAGVHALQGIGAGFVPKVLDKNVIDIIEKVSKDDAYKYAKMLGTSEGILVGISSGAALSAAVKLAKLKENEGKTIAVLLADTGERYLSSDLF